MQVLTTGTRSGLGRHLFEYFGGIAWNRDISREARDGLNADGTDVIIHSAFNSSSEVDSNSLYRYMADNVLLTYDLTRIPHQVFVYISTCEVYQGHPEPHREEDVPRSREILPALSADQVDVGSHRSATLPSLLDLAKRRPARQVFAGRTACPK